MLEKVISFTIKYKPQENLDEKNVLKLIFLRKKKNIVRNEKIDILMIKIKNLFNLFHLKTSLKLFILLNCI